jgi:hypothetical protein
MVYFENPWRNILVAEFLASTRIDVISVFPLLELPAELAKTVCHSLNNGAIRSSAIKHMSDLPLD